MTIAALIPNRDQVGRAATTAAIAGGWTYATDGTARVPFMGQSVPLWGLTAGVGAGASMAADYAHDLILPQLDASLKFDDMGAAGLTLASGGAAYAGLTSAIDSRLMNETGGFWQVAAVGAGSVAAGHWLYGRITEAMV